MMVAFYVAIGIYLLCAGSRIAGIWASNMVLEGVLLMLSGVFLIIAQVWR